MTRPSKRYSPGTVLTAMMLRRLIEEEGVSEIDFGRGDDDYKRGWGGSTSPTNWHGAGKPVASARYRVPGPPCPGTRQSRVAWSHLIRMRILYSHRIQSRDGQSVHVEELISALRKLGHEVLVVGPGFYENAHFGGESRFISLIRSHLPLVLGELAELAYNVPAYWRLRRAIRTIRPDLIYERYNLYYLAGTLLAKRNGVKLFLEVNAPLAEERSRHGGLRLRHFAHWLERYVWQSADRVLAVTGVLKEMIANAGVPSQDIEVVPNGIDPDRFTALPPRQQPGGRGAWVCRIRPRMARAGCSDHRDGCAWRHSTGTPGGRRRSCPACTATPGSGAWHIGSRAIYRPAAA